MRRLSISRVLTLCRGAQRRVWFGEDSVNETAFDFNSVGSFPSGDESTSQRRDTPDLCDTLANSEQLARSWSAADGFEQAGESLSHFLLRSDCLPDRLLKLGTDTLGNRVA